MIGRNDHRLRLAARERGNRICADCEREVGRPLCQRGVHETVNLDRTVAVEPACKRLCNVFDLHEFWV